ncbi:hypothetical protein CAter10_0191 [Collimonas arenae]|nr:hypothetical protein CAter10_0191 [Collimonas arenae]
MLLAFGMWPPLLYCSTAGKRNAGIILQRSYTVTGKRK